MLQTKFHLTTAQVLALHTTAVEVLPAPGPGKVIMIIATLARINVGSIPFLGGGGTGLFWGDPSIGWAFILISAADVLNPFSCLQSKATPDDTFDQAPLPEIENVPLSVKSFAPGYTTGNGSIDVELFYAISKLP